VVALVGIAVAFIGGIVVANMNNASAAERELTARRYDAAQALLGTTTAALSRERQWAFSNRGESISGHVDQPDILDDLDAAIAAQTDVVLLMPELQDESEPLVNLVLSGYGDLYGGEYPTGDMESEWDQRRRDFQVAANAYARAVREYFGIDQPLPSLAPIPSA
jgi:hypothetical protein